MSEDGIPFLIKFGFITLFLTLITILLMMLVWIFFI